MKETAYLIRAVRAADQDIWVKIVRQLWPTHPAAEMRTLFRTILKSPRQASWLAFSDSGQPIAFANASLRVDYVEGSNSSPVAYLEGIFVGERFRKQGIAQALVITVEQWARKKGAAEIASDTELHNKSSQKFHAAIGYAKAGTIVHFIKRLKNSL